MPPIPVESPAALATPVGFVGLGQMGQRIAGRLLASGHPLVVTSRVPAKRAVLAAKGAEVAATPAAVGKRVGAGVVFTMVRDARSVESVLFGPRGLVRELRPGALVVDLTTLRPEESRTIGARLGAAGFHFLDAPVGGSIDAALEGTLVFLVGGEPSDVERVRPLLDRLGRRVEHLGPAGSGSAMKLVNNLITIGHIALLAEALSFGEGLGLDRARMLEILGSGGGRSTMLDRKRSKLQDRRYDPEFRLSLALKDLGLIEASSDAVGRPVRMTREVRRLVREAVRQGHGEEDFSVVFEAALARRRPVGDR